MVYRWQDKHGIGPYRSDITSFELADMLHFHGIASSGGWVDKKHPCTTDEDWIDQSGEFVSSVGVFSAAVSKKYRFGFMSIEQANKWFDEDERELMKRDGFDLVEVDAEIMYMSETQLIFRSLP